MTTYYMNPYANTQTTPATLPSADAGYGGKLIARNATLTFASQASGSILVIGKVRAGEMWMGGRLTVDTSTSSATLAVGVTGDVARFKAAAAITTVNQPVAFVSNISASTPWLTDPIVGFTADTEILITTAAASLPSGGILLATIFLMVL